MRPLIAALVFAAPLLAAAPVAPEAAAQDAAAVSALKSLSRGGGSAPPPGVLEGVDFREALFLMDELTANERRRLRVRLDVDGDLRLPSEVAAALRARAPLRRFKQNP
ncbi:MAG: hypothetical protein AAGF90_06605 [Pseudomonadota bacterium]